jgi:hypothetical protein
MSKISMNKINNVMFMFLILIIGIGLLSLSCVVGVESPCNGVK